MSKTLKDASDEELKSELKNREDERAKIEMDAHITRMNAIIALGKAGVDAYCPNHSRTSCDDNRLDNGWRSGVYHARTGPRCTRCALLELVLEHEIPPPDVRIDVTISHPARNS